MDYIAYSLENNKNIFLKKMFPNNSLKIAKQILKLRKHFHSDFKKH